MTPSRPLSPADADEVPNPAELAALARECLVTAVRLARWVGSDRKITATGHLTDGDVALAAEQLGLSPECVLTCWTRARLAALVELRAGRANPGWRLHLWETDDESTLRGWAILFDGWTLTLPAPPIPDTELAAEALEQGPQLLSVLHLESDPFPVLGLVDLLRQCLEDHHVVRAGQRLALPALLGWMLEGLVAIGAVQRLRAPGEDGHDEDAVVLTPLGHWAVRGKIEEICAVAQTAGGHIEQSAVELLSACAGYSPGPARAEYRAWLSARPVEQAVAELLEVARGEDPLLRGLAFEALRIAGRPAAEAVQATLDEPLLRPYALLWLAETAGESVGEALTPQESALLWTDTAAAVVDHSTGRLLIQHLDQAATLGGVHEVLEGVRASGHPRTADVLAAIAAAHDDPVISKAARKAAFHVRTAGITGLRPVLPASAVIPTQVDEQPGVAEEEQPVGGAVLPFQRGASLRVVPPLD